MLDKLEKVLLKKWPKLGKLWMKFKEYFLYLVFGVLTTVVNYIVYWAATRPLGIKDLVANAIAWIAACAFAYVTNRIWVFESKAKGLAILKEIGEFIVGRLVSFGIEELILWVFVDICGFNDIVIKIISNVVVVILNYIFSKFIIFKKPKGEQQKSENADAETNVASDEKTDDQIGADR